MEKQKYLYKNSKCGGGTSSTVTLINAWISITGQRNIQKYRSIAYLGGFTIVALATIWFLSQSPTYTIEYKPKEKTGKHNKSKAKEDTDKSDKRVNNTTKSSVGWWSSIREKISNKLGLGKKSKLQKPIQKPKVVKPSNGSNKIGKLNGKKRTSKDNCSCGSVLSSKTSDATTNGSTGSSNIKNNSHDAKSTNISKKVQAPRRSNSDNLRQKDQIIQKNLVRSNDSSSFNRQQKDQTIRKNLVGSDDSTFNHNNCQQKDQTIQKNLIGSDDSSSFNHNNCQQKDQITRKIQIESCVDSSSSSNNSRQKDQIIQRTGSCDDNFVSNRNKVKQQDLRKLRLKTQDTHSSHWTNRENRYQLYDYSRSKHPKHPDKVNSTPHIQNVDNKESNHLTDLETRIAETIKKINFIDLQDRERYQEFYIPYIPLTLHETFDEIGHERVERYKKLLVRLGRQKQEDSNLESTLKMVQEFFYEKKYYESEEEDDDCHEKRVDYSDELDNFLDYTQNITSTKATVNDNFNCNKYLKFADVLAQDEQASRKRIERNLEILKMIDSYKQQGKETEESIKRSIEMFDEQRAKCKGMTRHLKRPSKFYDEFNRFEDRLMDIERQIKNLAEGLDDMDTCFTETLELFNDDGKMDNAATKYGPILIDDF